MKVEREASLVATAARIHDLETRCDPEDGLRSLSVAARLNDEGDRTMIRIKPSPTADTRTCDVTTVSKDQLLESSRQHIEDVRHALAFFITTLATAGRRHDTDKITDIDRFYADFQTRFTSTAWWDDHRARNRHHLDHPSGDGIPSDVNLIDVLDFIADCVMAGMARSGSVYPLQLPDGLLERAFQNTVELLKAQVVVEP